jgi:hypothetical protein
MITERIKSEEFFALLWKKKLKFDIDSTLPQASDHCLFKHIIL